MDRLTQFFRSFRTLALIGTLTGPMLPLPGLTSLAIANAFPVGADASLSGGTWAARPAFHALVDVNGDGFADLVYTIPAIFGTTGPFTNVYVQYSNGTSFGAPVVVATDSSTRVLLNCTSSCHYALQALINAVGDVNGDGHPDILFADGTIALGNGSGFGPKTAWGGDASLSGGTWAARPAFHALADVNGDGFADLVYTIPAIFGTTGPFTNVYVQYSNGTAFDAPVIVAEDASTQVLLNCVESGCHYAAQALINAVGDVNGDHHADILYANGSLSSVPIAFTVIPTYFIGSVIYVPPGQGSSIAYGAGTVTGTTVSTTETWKLDSTVGANNIGEQVGGGSVTFGTMFSGSTTNSVDMQQTINQVQNYKALPSDLINHDYDLIQIFLDVNVNASKDFLGNVTWNLDFSKIAKDGFAENGYNIPVGCLRPNSTIPSSDCTALLNFLSSKGITSVDYPHILGADPFADPTAPLTPDPSRYVLIDSLSYLFDPTTSTVTYTENNSTTITNSNTTTFSFSVGITNNVTDTEIATTFKFTNTFTWTVSSTDSNKTGSTGSSAFTLANPSSSYGGPNTLFVYMDTIFKTFMFSFNQ